MAKNFNSQHVVDGYDVHIRKLIPGYEVVHQQIQALLKTYVNEHAHVLIVGCGTGYELGYLLQLFPNWISRRALQVRWSKGLARQTAWRPLPDRQRY